MRINSFYCSNFNDFFDFNVPFQVTIGGTKTFIGKREYVLGGKNPHCGKKLPAGGGLQMQFQLLHDRFSTYKTESSSTKETLFKAKE